jgi:hypothetical protein
VPFSRPHTSRLRSLGSQRASHALLENDSIQIQTREGAAGFPPRFAVMIGISLSCPILKGPRGRPSIFSSAPVRRERKPADLFFCLHFALMSLTSSFLRHCHEGFPSMHCFVQLISNLLLARCQGVRLQICINSPVTPTTKRTPLCHKPRWRVCCISDPQQCNDIALSGSSGPTSCICHSPHILRY